MKIVLYTNILTPYRKYFYDLFYQECKNNGDEFKVLVMADIEPNRSWHYEDYKEEYTILLKNRMLSKGETYIHFNSNLGEYLKKIKPDVVVCAGSYLCPGTWKVARMKKTLGFKCFFWSESHLNEQRAYRSFKIKIRDIIRKAFYKKYDGFWYAGKMSKDFIEKYANPDAKYIFVPNLIDEKKYFAASQVSVDEKNKIRKKLNIDEDKTVFICPARLSPVKGILEFITIAKDVENKDKAVFLIAGTGELENEIRKAAAEANLDFRLLGQKSQDEMIELYSVADIFLLPSLSDPNPLTCIEALWAGLPLLISNHCGNYPEVVKINKNGYIFSYAKSAVAIKQLCELIGNCKWRAIASRESQELAESIYNSQKNIKKLYMQMKIV